MLVASSFSRATRPSAASTKSVCEGRLGVSRSDARAGAFRSREGDGLLRVPQVPVPARTFPEPVRRRPPPHGGGFRAAARRAIRARKAGRQVVMVLSAMGKTTDHLEDL